MGFPSVCCEYGLLPLVNKEATLAYVRAEYSKAGNPSQDRGRKKAVSGNVITEEERRQNITGKLQPHSDT